MGFTVQELTETFFFFLKHTQIRIPWSRRALLCCPACWQLSEREEVPRALKRWSLVSDGEAWELRSYHLRRPQRLWDHLPHLSRLQQPVFCLLGKLYTHSCKPGYHSPSECFQGLATSQWAVSMLVSVGDFSDSRRTAWKSWCVCVERKKRSLCQIFYSEVHS